jgi:hypothetical protein
MAKPTAKIAIGSEGLVYGQDKNKALGKCQVIDINGDEYLCFLSSWPSAAENKNISSVDFIANNVSMGNPPGTITVRQIEFSSLPGQNKFYISSRPLPASRIEPFDSESIRNFLAQIEQASQNRFQADLVSMEYINLRRLPPELISSDKKKIYLGTSEGKLGMIERERSSIRFSPISDSTMKKFKAAIIFHVVLQDKEKS